MGSNIYKNPLSKTVKRTPKFSALDREPLVVTLGEVLSIEQYGAKAGIIQYRDLLGTNTDVLQGIYAVPLIPSVRLYPIIGEQVIIFAVGTSYYITLNSFNNPITNQGPLRFNSTKAGATADTSKVSTTPYTFTRDTSKTYPVTAVNAGDVVIEGRSGHSLKFGSTVKLNDEAQNLYSLSDLSANGDPIVILRNDSKSASEDIQKDGASIYLCSSQKIFVDDGKNGFDGITGAWSSLNISGDNVVSEQYQLDAAQVQVMSEMRDQALAQAEQLRLAGDAQGAAAATERARYLNSQVSNGEADSAAYIEAAPPQIDPNVTELCKKIVAYAQQDAIIPTVETPPESNRGPRVDQMLRTAGVAPGNFWCAAAVTAWFKAAGADLPPGPASCDSWLIWARRNGTFSTKPVPGAAVLYGSFSDANHIGIVEAVKGDGSIVTIEGNTSGGTGFNRNGGGVYRKRPNSKRVLGYVLPTQRGKLAACAQT